MALTSRPATHGCVTLGRTDSGIGQLRELHCCLATATSGVVPNLGHQGAACKVEAMGVIGNLLRALARADQAPGSYDARRLPFYVWRCECGAHSRSEGFLSESDASIAADRHQWRLGVGHPMPTVSFREASQRLGQP